jgi:hypothetical protein
MGRSEWGDTSKWMLERWARDVKEFCDKVGVEKPVWVILLVDSLRLNMLRCT